MSEPIADDVTSIMWACSCGARVFRHYESCACGKDRPEPVLDIAAMKPETDDQVTFMAEGRDWINRWHAMLERTALSPVERAAAQAYLQQTPYYAELQQSTATQVSGPAQAAYNQVAHDSHGAQLCGMTQTVVTAEDPAARDARYEAALERIEATSNARWNAWLANQAS